MIVLLNTKFFIDDLSYSEKCYILLKYIKSKNRKNLQSFLREKKGWF